MERMLEEYLSEILLKNYSERTVQSVKNNVKKFFLWLENEHEVGDIENITRGHIKGYIKHKQMNGNKATYINSILKNLRMFFSYLYEEEYISINPTLRVSFQKEDKVIIQTFSEEEIKRMISIYPIDTFLNIRNRCIVIMLLDTGIRNTELCTIKCEDVLSNSILIQGKGNKQRVVPISPTLRKIMVRYENKRAKYVKEHYENDYFFYPKKVDN